MSDPQNDQQNDSQNDPQHVHHYRGPVINGSVSRSQFFWDNQTVNQNQQNDAASAAPGYEELAALVRDLLRQLPRAGLGEQDQEDAQAAAEEVLGEITGPDAPEPGRLRRAVATLRGALAPVATGVAAGATAGAQQWALTAIQGLAGVV
ncbi:hypothetical protein ACIGEZ_30875 [Streptomyces sp. NPDC085481]|uniref:hypothetical protein n=1 Tax=Streptomyces sp. NPDC085481 TaxID=3365727 RepID=UPI0037D930FF